ncbi:DNA polymerase/3'-5' exonuclease PolX [Egibacter rhizosphaerae]|uniref:DNA polymerase/3'-5' exonuclease PolX n=1 Tax=Egibacter rhizosphaerae TaxID=1670831 RepID=UPI0013F16A0D|nr:DNA polymerase/3'-5' exonuclease PolX [Egibacter rhizosphaerae]
MSWTNTELERSFKEIAELLELDGADRFRVRAYERAAAAAAAAREDLGTVERERLTEVEGVGSSTAEKIIEWREHGSMSLLEDLRARVPSGVRELTGVPGLGPKLARRLHDELGVDSLDALRAAIDAGDVAALSGLGAKRAENLRAGLSRLGGKDADRHPIGDVLPLAERLVRELEELPSARAAAYAGSLRRLRETIGDLDVLVATHHPGDVRAAVPELGPVAEVVSGGDRKLHVRSRSIDIGIDIRFVPPDAWGAALCYFTGSKAHNVRVRERAVRRGLSLNEYGLWRDETRIAGSTEEEVYVALDLPWISPSLREDTGEVEAGDSGHLPDVVEPADLCGDLHGHSDWSGDGRASLDEMVAAAASRGWDYWAVTDHAIGLAINGLDTDGFARRREAIAELRPRAGIAILDAVELNIAVDGSVDFDDAELAGFDLCVAAIHTQMDRPRDVQTRRVLTAMANPHVHVIGHLTGRKIGRRPPIDLDVDAVVAEAVRTGTALEVNGSPARLDLSGELVRKAVEAGATLTISSDAHEPGELRNVETGVGTAQRGWARAADVLNCRDADGLRAFVDEKRTGRG